MNINTITIIRILMIFAIFIVIVSLLKQRKAFKYEQRLGKYTIEPLNNKSNSIFDNVKNRYIEFIISLRKTISKSFFLTKLSKRYEKYTTYGERITSIDYITNKLIISLAFVLLAIISRAIQSKILTIWGIIVNLAIGFYILDLYLIIQNKRKAKQIKSQMLRAIIIMNNAFKSGKSTLQAVDIASKELSEPLNHEFEKMYKDMKYGLSVDNVFDRFAKRINIEEATYISSSLIILNKTGGNIVKVFSQIEKTLFDKKKLNEELKNLTASSNLIVKILTVVPIAFIGIIYMLNPEYFNPLFSSPLGYMIIILIIIMFIIYVFILQKVMKVKV